MNKFIKDYGIILDGSIYEKYYRCGKKNCKRVIRRRVKMGENKWERIGEIY